MPINSTGNVLLRSMHRAMGTFPAAMSIWAKQSSQTDAIIMAQGQSDADRDVSMFWLNNGVTKLSRHRNPGFGDSGTIDSGGLTGLRLTVANYASASSRSTSYDGVIGTANTTALTDDIASHDSIYLFGLGTNNSAGSAFFVGVIAEAHFYTKPLTQAQITALKNGTSKPEQLVDTDGTTSIWIDGWQLKAFGDWTSMKNGWVLSIIGAGTIASETTLAHPVARAAPDTTAPTLASSAVANGTPTVVNLTMSEAMDTGFVPAASAFTVSGHTVSSVAITGSTINLTVSAAFVNGEAARTVAYTQPGTNNARDLAGNLLVNFTGQAITNNVAAVDTTPPTFSSAQVANAAPANIVITMSETLAAFTPAASAFAVSGGKTVSSVARSGATVTLTCSAAYAFGDTITVTYTKPGTNMLQDAAGNQTASFGPSAVTNNISNGTSVTITSPSAGGKRVADGTYRASVACNAVIFNATTLVEVDRKTGLTSPGSGAFSLTSTVVSSGARVAVVVRADANGEDLGLFFATAV